MCSITGCGSGKTNLEDATVPLALGLDVEDQKLHYYVSAPVFSKDIQKKSREAEGIAEGLRQSKNQQDAQFPGSVAGRNYQVIVVGKELLKYKDWFKVMDVTFRDPRNTITDRIIAVDGPVSDIFNFQSKDQPPILIFLKAIVESGSKSSATVSTTAQELHRQLYDRAMTPAVSEIKIENNKIILKGTTLLSHQAQYRTSLTYQESSLLQILKKEAGPGISLTFPVDKLQQTVPYNVDNVDKVSFTLGGTSVKIKSSYENGEFRYKVNVKSIIAITEKFLEFELLHNFNDMEKKLSEEMKVAIEKLIEKFQQYEIDPVGFGFFARAYQYPSYKEVQDNWGKELSRAQFDVEVDLRIAATGAVE
ncbi:Ger(x)C family spore germination protein [Paenibacillus sp. ACRRY]|uniref:Ger(x)C family spore germination protein n=1 Tax=Paenibacillus sp. ACRRY TaxID=2918208 RepID=UPI001EF49AA8|nr:Ger(x)C family spore germination protein [Paenibacillus sp. ACRRY]MCG7381866.1 Ger(x)C family spore germination protein [Paenibacillus sp. ACRRY]